MGIKAVSQIILTFFLLSHSLKGYCQAKTDTVEKLKEVTVRAYFSEQPILPLPVSVSVIDSRQLRTQQGTSLLPVINTVPGLRMEERSPGSYRLSIRGSLLRSPFGIRNIKVYMDEFPLTDAGGNTYLNSLDVNTIDNLLIIKGPDGSLFGANTGGVVLLNPNSPNSDSSGVLVSLSGGSFDLFHENLGIKKRAGNHFIQLNQAYQNSNGYRENSSLNRHYGQVRYKWNYSERSQLRLLSFYSDLDYQTPGGLTRTQYGAAPRSARPATAVVPGAVEQHAAIFNKTLYAGALNESEISGKVLHSFAVFGSHTDFKNPFITNFEVRDENTAGIRTFVEVKGQQAKYYTWKANAGFEWQQTWSDIRNYDNNAGERGGIQSSDELSARQFFYFTRFSARVLKRVDFELAASINHYRLNFEDQSLVTAPGRTFSPQLMPRIALSYQLTEDVAWRGSISRGYSPPTIAEIRASDQQINTSLQPENGWNYETGIRLRNYNDRFWLDASVFHYQLQDAIVRRVNADDTEFFQNAGGTRQIGFESQMSGWLISPSANGMVRGLQLRTSLTINNFKFSNYLNGAADYSGNRLTGVPEQVIVSSADISLPASLALFIQHNSTAKIPLNDSNNEYSGSYNLIQAKIRWQNTSLNPALELFAGIDNLLNEKYSLGNDLNAFGGRYYNAAPIRNFYFGLKANFK